MKQSTIAGQIIDALSQRPRTLEMMLNQRNERGRQLPIHIDHHLSIVTSLIKLEIYCILVRDIVTDLNCWIGQ